MTFTGMAALPPGDTQAKSDVIVGKGQGRGDSGDEDEQRDTTTHSTAIT